MPKINHPKSAIPARLKGLHLFHFDGAPCAQRVRFALGEKGLSRGREIAFDGASAKACAGEVGQWVSRRVSLVKREHMTPAYAAIHPNMVVPALVHDGTLYLESMDIISYLDEAFGGARLVPTDPTLRALTMARVEQAKALHRSIRFVTFHWGLGRLAMLNGKQRVALQQLAAQGSDGEDLVSFYQEYSTDTIADSIYDEHLDRLYSAFAEVDLQMQDGRQFFMGDDLSIADAFWAMKVLRLIECGYPFAEHHPRLLAWYQRISSRPSFQHEVMGKNQFMHHFFKGKAGLETLLGIGLKNAVHTLIQQKG